MNRIDMPPDFQDRAYESLEALAAIYGISKATARSWRTKLGIVTRPGAPKGNRNRMGADGHTPRKKGSDDPAEIRTCLSCTAAKCRGKCAKVH